FLGRGVLDREVVWLPRLHPLSVDVELTAVRHWCSLLWRVVDPDGLEEVVGRRNLSRPGVDRRAALGYQRAMPDTKLPPWSPTQERLPTPPVSSTTRAHTPRDHRTA